MSVNFDSGITMRCVSCGEDKPFNEESLFSNNDSKLGWTCDDCMRGGKGV